VNEKTFKKISIVIPAYNEAKTIRKLVERIFQVKFPIEFELIIVDDHSADRTHRIVKILETRHLENKIRLFRNEINQGKGYCIQRGIQNASGDIIVVQDADFEYDPNEIPKLLKPIIQHQADVVYGSRFLEAKRPAGMAFPNYIANRFLTLITNILFGTKLTDMETCYKVVRADLIKEIKLETKRFDFEPEITAKLAKKGSRIIELPISYHGRSASEGKKIRAKDFFIALKVLLQNRISR